MKKIVCIALACVLLAGCGSEPKLDTSSEAAFEQSMESVMEKMSEPEKEQFAESLQIIMLDGVENVFALAMSGKDPEEMEKEFLGKINGKTAKDINKLAAATKAANENKN